MGSNGKPAPMRRYAIAEVSLVIGGYDIKGGSDSDFIAIERNGELGTYTVDAAGEVTYNVNTDFSATVTLSLMPTSIGHQTLASILAQQQAATGSGGSMPTLDFRLSDPNSGAFVSDAYCAILTAPGHTFGKEAEAVEWTLLLPNAYRPGQFKYAPNIT